METGYNNAYKELTFRDVVLRAEQKVLEILSKELRLTKKVIPMGEHRSEIVVEEEDTRESFVQAVQSLALILKPYFDEQMEKAYGDFDELVDLFYFEFFGKYKEYIFETIETLGKYFKTDEDDDVNKIQIEKIHLKYKVRRAKIVFRELNLLLKRVDYLKSSIYGEGDSDDEVVEDSAIAEVIE